MHELTLHFRPPAVGVHNYFLNVVDSEFHQVLGTWLVHATAKPPPITKAFTIALPTGQIANKRVAFRNPYPELRTFYLKTDRPDLLVFKDSALEIPAGEKRNMALRFLPSQQEGRAQILIFISDADGKN